MEDECVEELGRPISNMKVAELRDELTRRALIKTGNKKELIDRLRTAIQRQSSQQSNVGAEQPRLQSTEQGEGQISSQVSSEQGLATQAAPIDMTPSVGQNFQDECQDLTVGRKARGSSPSKVQQQHQELDLVKQDQVEPAKLDPPDASDLTQDQDVSIPDQSFSQDKVSDQTSSREQISFEKHESSAEVQNLTIAQKSEKEIENMKNDSQETSEETSLSNEQNNSIEIKETCESSESRDLIKNQQSREEQNLNEADKSLPEQHSTEAQNSSGAQKVPENHSLIVGENKIESHTSDSDQNKLIEDANSNKKPESTDEVVAKSQDTSANRVNILLKRGISELKSQENSGNKEKRRKWSSRAPTAAKTTDCQGGDLSQTIATTGGISSQKIQELVNQTKTRLSDETQGEVVAQPDGVVREGDNSQQEIIMDDDDDNSHSGSIVQEGDISKPSSAAREGEVATSQELDDFFNKTKSVPHLFWLPLTEEQADVRQAERKERELKIQEQARKSRSPQRRRSPPPKNRSPPTKSHRRRSPIDRQSPRNRSPLARRSPPRHRSPLLRRSSPRHRSPPSPPSRRRSPALIRRSPAPMLRSPARRSPGPIRRSPGMIRRSPGLTRRSPGPITGPIRRSPGPIRRSPGLIRRSPGPIRRSPVNIRRSPGPVRRSSPGPRRRSPGMTRRSPRPMLIRRQNSPGPIRRSPPGPIRRSPGLLRRSPGPQRRSPGLIRRSPGPGRRSPLLVRRSPAPVRGSSPRRRSPPRKRSPPRRRSPTRQMSPPHFASDQRRPPRPDRLR